MLGNGLLRVGAPYVALRVFRLNGVFGHKSGNGGDGHQRPVRIGDADVVGPQIPARADFAGFAAQGADAPRLEVGNVRLGVDAIEPGGIGNRGERHVHQRENGSAVRVAHAVAVALVQRHDRHAMLRPDFEELDPHMPGERIMMVEMVTDFFVRRHPALLMRVRRPSRDAGKRCL